MAHVAKYNKGAMGHMLSHYDRSKNRLGENIDGERTHLNYNLAEDFQPMKQLDFIHKRLGEVKIQNRKDVNVLCDWVVTAPKDLPSQEYKQFFKASCDFMCMRYGKENVVSAYVHMDETTPHVHFAFIPVKHGFKEDKKNPDISTEYKKVSAKEVITRYDLKTFHQDLENYVERELGHKVNILNEATKEGNKSIEELKRQSATKRLQEVTEKASKIVSKAQIQAHVINDSLIAIQAEYEAKKAYVKEFDRISDVSVMYPAEAKVTEKGLIHKQKFVTVPAELWEAKHISANEKNYLQKVNEELEKKLQEFQTTTSSKNFATLSKHINELEKQNMALNKQNHALAQQLNMSEKNASKIMNRVNKVLSKLPDEIADEFVKVWKTMEQNKGLER